MDLLLQEMGSESSSEEVDAPVAPPSQEESTLAGDESDSPVAEKEAGADDSKVMAEAIVENGDVAEAEPAEGPTEVEDAADQQKEEEAGVEMDKAAEESVVEAEDDSAAQSASAMAFEVQEAQEGATNAAEEGNEEAAEKAEAVIEGEAGIERGLDTSSTKDPKSKLKKKERSSKRSSAAKVKDGDRGSKSDSKSKKAKARGSETKLPLSPLAQSGSSGPKSSRSRGRKPLMPSGMSLSSAEVAASLTSREEKAPEPLKSLVQLYEEQKKAEGKEALELFQENLDAASTMSFGSVSLFGVGGMTAKTKHDEMQIGRRCAGEVFQFAGVVKQADSSSLYASCLLRTSEVVATMNDLNASWTRNIEKRLTAPLKDLIRLEPELKEKLRQTGGGDAPEASLAAVEEVNAKLVNDTLAAVISFMELYKTYFKIGQQSLSKCYEDVMEYTSVIALYEDSLTPPFVVGERLEVPMEEVIFHGMLEKKGAVRHNWKKRWFVLTSKYLLYFTNKEELLLKGFFLLENATVMETNKKKLRFAVASGQRTLHLCAETTEMVKQWMELIISCVVVQPLGASTDRTEIKLVEPDVLHALSEARPVPSSLQEFFASDQFSRHWRDFRAKTPEMLQWVVQPDVLAGLFRCFTRKLPESLPQVDVDAIDGLAPSDQTADSGDDNASTKLKKSLSTLGRIAKAEGGSARSALGGKGAGGGSRSSVRDISKDPDCNAVVALEFASQAVTVLAFDESIVGAVLDNASDLLPGLFSIIEAPAPIPALPMGIFCEVLHILLDKRPHATFGYIREHKEIMEAFLRHFGNERLLRLLINFWHYDQCKEKIQVLNETGIKALNLLVDTDHSHSDETFNNASIFLRVLLRKHGLLNMRPETTVLFNRNRSPTHTLAGNIGGLPMRGGGRAPQFSPFEDEVDTGRFSPRSQDSGSYSPRADTRGRSGSTVSRPVVAAGGVSFVGGDDDGEEEDEAKAAAVDEEHKKYLSVRKSLAGPLDRNWISSMYEEEEMGGAAGGAGAGEGAGGVGFKVAPAKKPRRGPMAAKSPFMTQLQIPGTVGKLVEKALMNKNKSTAMGVIEFLICVLSVSRVKPAVTTQTKEEQERYLNAQQLPPIVAALSKEMTTLYALLRPKADKPLGLFKLSVVRLVVELVNTGFPRVHVAMVESKVLGRCCDVFLASKNNSILHNTLEELFVQIFTSSSKKTLQSYLMKKYHLPKKLLAAFAECQAVEEETKARVSLYPHLISVATAMYSRSRGRKALRKSEEWRQFYSKIVRPYNKEGYFEPIELPEQDQERRKENEEKWKKRWEDFNFLISYK